MYAVMLKQGTNENVQVNCNFNYTLLSTICLLKDVFTLKGNSNTLAFVGVDSKQSMVFDVWS